MKTIIAIVLILMQGPVQADPIVTRDIVLEKLRSSGLTVRKGGTCSVANYLDRVVIWCAEKEHLDKAMKVLESMKPIRQGASAEVK